MSLFRTFSFAAFKVEIAALAISAALVSGAPANAATIDYIFTGLGTGTLGTTAFGGFPFAPDVSFTFTITGDTTAVTAGSPSGPPDNGNPFRNVGTSATFVSGSLNANLSNTLVNLNNNNQANTFPSIGFFQTSPSVVGEALGTPAGGQLGSYDLTTAFAQINSNSPNFVSFIVQTFATDQGNLTFDHISFLTFEAVTRGPAVPLPAALPLFATGLGALGLLGWRRKQKAQAA